MKSLSTSDALNASSAGAPRDLQLSAFARSIVDGARTTWGDRIIAEGNGTFDPRQLYTETHYALAAALLHLHDPRDAALLDVAESRLRLWATGTYPLTFFNAMAICLTAVVLKQSDVRHDALERLLQRLLKETREHRHVALTQWCGNNAYLQQVAIDTILLPVARGADVTRDGVDLLLREFRAFRSPEGLFFDLPRNGIDHERLFPPTYVMKMLFLLGVCHQLHPTEEFADLFQAGMRTMVPLLTEDGTCAYFGRTDNSPFASGLTIFNLRKLAALVPHMAPVALDECARAERFYQSFPRAASGVLESNRFADAGSAAEAWSSKDAYAYEAQYSLASCAYALLGSFWFPAHAAAAPARSAGWAQNGAVISRDLGVVKLRGLGTELIARTGSQLTSWDRRYLGPTILRMTRGNTMLVGAICRTVDRSPGDRRGRRASRVGKVLDLFRDRYVQGPEHLDGTSVGFLPVVRHGTSDYLPYEPVFVDASGTCVNMRHEMVKVSARGWHPCVVEGVQRLHFTVPGLKPRQYVAPRVSPASDMTLDRTITLTDVGCDIEDRIAGDLRGRTVLFSTRRMPRTAVKVIGLEKVATTIGWGSDGRHVLELYSATASGAEIRYRCEIGEAS